MFGILSSLVAKHITLLCARSRETVILATVSELSRLDLGYLAVNTLTSVLTMKHVWEAKEGRCSVASLEHGAEMHPTVSLRTALIAVSCHCYLGLFLVWLTDILISCTLLLNNSLSNQDIGKITQMD